jgi:hypothetical protein
MKQTYVIPAAGYYRIRASSSQPDYLRIYKDRVRLNTRLYGDSVVGLAHEWTGHLAEGDFIEAEGETLTLVVEPYDPAGAHQRHIESLNINVSETVRVGDRTAGS